MNSNTPTWTEPAPGVKMLKLYETALNPDWPRIVILDLSADRFKEFKKDALAFDKAYKVFYPEYPISKISTCAMPPAGTPPPKGTSRWTVVLLKGGVCTATCAAYNQS